MITLEEATNDSIDYMLSKLKTDDYYEKRYEIISHIHKKVGILFIVKFKEMEIGFINLEIDSSYGCDLLYEYYDFSINNFFIHKEYRNNGFSYQIINELEQYIRNNFKFCKLCIRVLLNKNNKKFWEKMGYSQSENVMFKEIDQYKRLNK